MPKIENWAVVEFDNGYTAPELRRVVLTGTVYEHASFPDGKKVVTSRIMSAVGRVVKTRNTEYELGNPTPEYLVWLESKGLKYNHEQPISFK